MSITALTLPPFTTETLGKQALGLRYCTGGNECLFVMNVKASQSTEIRLHCPIRSEITAFPQINEVDKHWPNACDQALTNICDGMGL